MKSKTVGITKTLLVLLMCLMLLVTAFAAIGCEKQKTDPVDPDPVDPDPKETLQIGVVFGDETEEKEVYVVDYKNALAGFLFYDKSSKDYTPIKVELTAVKVDGTVLDAANYEYQSGILEFTEDYFKTLELGKTYVVKAEFGEDVKEFSVKMTDDGEPAYSYLADSVISKVYLVGSEISLPVASKSPASIQNISATYALTDSEGKAVEYADGKFIATEGKYNYVATFSKNGSVVSTKTTEFSVIDLDGANLASKDIASVFGGTYDETEGAAKVDGTQTISGITIPKEYSYIRLSYKGEGTVTADSKTELSSEDYAVARIAVSNWSSVSISASGTLYIKSLELLKSCAFTAEDIETIDFADKEQMSLWSYEAKYGTPAWDDTNSGIAFEGTSNSWTYALREGIIQVAYNNGYKYLVITYIGKGTTRVFNDTTGDWSGYSKDLSAAETAKRISYNLDDAAKDVVIDSTSGFSIITNTETLVLTEFRFYKEDVVEPDEPIVIDYTTANLASKELVEKWYYNSGSGVQPSYDETEGALVLPANENYDTYTFANGAIKAAQDKGYNAVKVVVKGSNGEISLFVGSNWGRNVKYSVKTNGEFAEATLYFGDLVFTENSGIAVLASDAKGGDPIVIKEMKFVNAEAPVEEPDYTTANLASKELVEKWYYHSGSGVQPSYDETEGALVLPANGNYDTYTFSNGAVKAAKDKGFNAITFTVKGSNASIRVFESGPWNSDAVYNVSGADYTTFTMHFAHLNIGETSGITALVSDNFGGAALYVKEMKFAKIDVSSEAMNLMTGNLVSKENIGLWESLDSNGTVSYDDTNGYMKFDFSATGSVRLKTDYAKMLEWAKLFGKTKLVWVRGESTTDNQGRVRIYDTEDNWKADRSKKLHKAEANILGFKNADNSRYCWMTLDQLTTAPIFAIECKNATTTYPTCNIILTSVYFA